MQILLRHKLLVGVVAAVAAVAAAGGAYAATNSSTNPQQAYLNDVANRLHVSPATLESALKGALVDRLNAMVKSGKLTQAQANRIEQALAKGGRLPFLFAVPGKGFGPGRGFGLGRAFGGGKAFGPGMRLGGLGLRIGGLNAAASYLGVSDTQLVTDLASGKSLAQVATKQGKSVTGLEQAIVTAEKAQLDRLVSAGVLTSAQEQKALSHLSAKVDKLVNQAGFLKFRIAKQGMLMPAPQVPVPVPQTGASGPGPNFSPAPPSA